LFPASANAAFTAFASVFRVYYRSIMKSLIFSRTGKAWALRQPKISPRKPAASSILVTLKSSVALMYRWTRSVITRRISWLPKERKSGLRSNPTSCWVGVDIPPLAFSILFVNYVISSSRTFTFGSSIVALIRSCSTYMSISDGKIF